MGTGAGVALLAVAGVVGGRIHRLDDLARTVGLEPQRRAAEADLAILKRARTDQVALLALTAAVSTAHNDLTKSLAPLMTNLQSQLKHLGGPLSGTANKMVPTDTGAALDLLITDFRGSEHARSSAALNAVSGEFAQVLAAMSAGLAQAVVVLKALRKQTA